MDCRERVLLVGDDWAEEHHDVKLQNEAGRVLGRAKLPERVEGIARLRAMIGEHLGDEQDDAAVVVVGIETERGPWVQALIAAGYQIYAINPLQVARYRERQACPRPRATPPTRTCWAMRSAEAAEITAELRGEYLGQPTVVAGAYAATARAQAAILTVLDTEIKTMEEQVDAHFDQHPDAEVHLSQPGLGVVLGARVLAEFGDDNDRYADARARKNYARTGPITRQPGKRKFVLAGYVHNDRLVDALGLQAFTSLRGSPGARA